MTKIPGLTVFAYIVEETRGVNSKFIISVCSPTGPPAVTALLKYSFRFNQYSILQNLRLKNQVHKVNLFFKKFVCTKYSFLIFFFKKKVSNCFQSFLTTSMAFQLTESKEQIDLANIKIIRKIFPI